MNNHPGNNDRYPLIEQEWSVHAQLTFTHTPGDEAHTMACPAHPCYGFQRGNIFFTTSPPPPPHQTSTSNYGSLPSGHRRTPQPYNRRCMSTCNIVLGRSSPPHCRRHHSVTMTTGDPVAVTTVSHDPCDICSGGGRSPTSARRAHTFTSHFCTRVPDKSPVATVSKDAASQTSCASEKDTLQLPTASHSKSQGAKRLNRSPARMRGKSPLVLCREKEAQSSTDNCCSRKSQKKQQPPRTVHIDVYCTESEQSGFGSSEGEGESSPQTVYENDRMKVIHKREKERLPQAIVRQKRRTLSETSSSSLYPSVQSSTVSVGASFCPSSKTNSNSGITSMTSSCALFSDDSLAATSWKDTTTEMESLRQSDISLTKSESFEYEDFADRLRIREKEKKWAACEGSKSWRSPETERKHLLQQQKCQQYVQRRGSPFPRWKPDDSSEESDHSSYSEMAWSFGRLDELTKRISPTVKREDTVKRGGRSDPKVLVKRSESGSLSDSGAVSCSSSRTRDTIGPFGKKPDSPKHKLDSVVISPFAPNSGAESDFLSKARKFGAIVDGLRKPGHHVGPSKNPDCLCENCQRHYKDRWLLSRGRARSLGDEASIQRDRLKATLQNVIQSKRPETMEEFAAENDPSCV